MNVLHLYSTMGTGGAERMLLELASGLETMGVHNIIGAPRYSYLAEKAAKLKLVHRPLSIRGSFEPFGIFSLVFALRREKIDIVHVHQGKLYWAAIIANLLAGRPAKIIFHRHMQTNHPWYSRLHYRFADKVIAVSQAVAQGLIAIDRVPASKCAVVYNGVDTSVFNPSVPGGDIRRKYGFSPEDVIVGAVGAINKPKGKGQRTLLEAAQTLKKEFPNARYLIVGEGTLRRELEERGRVLGLERTVIFTGQQENIERYMAAMDICCLLSWDTEAFGQVMAEAQALGKPVIGTNVGGIPETIQDKITGFLIPPDDTSQLRTALLSLLSDASLRSRMGMTAAVFAAKTFSKELTFSATLAIYREVLNV